MKNKIKNYTIEFKVKLLPSVIVTICAIVLICGIYYAYAAWNSPVSGGQPLTATMWNDLVAHVSSGPTISPVYMANVAYTAGNTQCSPQTTDMGAHTVCFLTSYDNGLIDYIAGDGRPTQSECEISGSPADWKLTAIWYQGMVGVCPLNTWIVRFGVYCEAMCLN